jgi:alkaline phosphatase D
VATEFVGTSITSGGKGSLAEVELGKLQAENPCVRYFSRERGYVLCTVTPELWRSDYLTAEDVTQQNGPVVLRSSFVVESGKAGAIKA